MSIHLGAYRGTSHRDVMLEKKCDTIFFKEGAGCFDFLQGYEETGGI